MGSYTPMMQQYLEIKKGRKPSMPLTMLFGAKAAPAYIIAKDIIHLILCLQELCEKDPEVSPYLKVVMVENYNVSLAEKLIPACDFRADFSRFQGSKRYRQYEIYAKRSGNAWYHGRRQCRDF